MNRLHFHLHTSIHNHRLINHHILPLLFHLVHHLFLLILLLSLVCLFYLFLQLPVLFFQLIVLFYHLFVPFHSLINIIYHLHHIIVILLLGTRITIRLNKLLSHLFQILYFFINTRNNLIIFNT